jgi:nitrate/nitrite transporter NarK
MLLVRGIVSKFSAMRYHPARLMPARTRLERAAFMACLIIAGEAIFSLPFHVARFFRPTVLRVFELSNTELGAAQAVYGIVAMLAYFPGGLLADRFAARRLIVISLATTSLGGMFFARFPPYRELCVLFGFWGLTTILLFWAALIRATREWGGEDEQGRAYGILDGGRGLFAALLAAAALLLFQTLLPDDPAAATEIERARALRGVIYAYTAATAGAAILCWLFVPEGNARTETERGRAWEHIEAVVRRPTVWLQALIVVCAYVGYKGIDNYAVFAVDGYGMNEVQGARVSTISSWVRPVAAIGAGWVADRITSSRVAAICFATLVLSYGWLAVTPAGASQAWVLYANVLITSAAIFGLRGVYFALFQEGGLPLAATGTAVGLVSFIGYTPDVFVHVVGGWLLDRSPGVAGHRHFLMFLGTFAVIGLAASVAFERLRPKPGGN